jgi:hypothetical protein
LTDAIGNTLGSETGAGCRRSGKSCLQATSANPVTMTSSPSPRPQGSEAAVRLLLILLGAMLALTALNLLFHTLFDGPQLFKGRTCQAGHSYFPGPLFHPGDRFMDYFNMQRFRPESGQTSALPPPLILLYQMAERLTTAAGPVVSAAVFALLQFGLFAASLCRLLGSPKAAPALPFHIRLTLAAALSLCSYPVYFAIDRGNFALTVCAILNFAIDAHLRDQKWRAAILIGLAAALRITPLLFAAIYLSRENFRYLLAATVSTLLFWALTLLLVPMLLDGYGLASWLNGFSGHEFMYTTWTHGLGWSSSLYNFVRLVRYLIGIPVDAILSSAYAAEKLYSVFSLAIILLITWRIRSTGDIIGFALLAWAYVALPHVTGDYYLAMLIGPLLLLATREKPDFLAIAILVLLLVPKDYYYFYVMPHRLFDLEVLNQLEYRHLLSKAFKPSSIQALLINPLLLIVLGLRLALKK